MSKERIKRINTLLQKSLSEIFRQESNFSPEVIVTIQKVETSPDLVQSKIRISVFPSKKAEEVIGSLKKNIGHFQRILNKKLKMKKVPRIIFELDFTEEKAARIEELLKRI